MSDRALDRAMTSGFGGDWPVLRAEAAELFGASAVRYRLASSATVELKVASEQRLPLWQFDDESPDGAVLGLAELLLRYPAVWSACRSG
jgi:hypothetical protein